MEIFRTPLFNDPALKAYYRFMPGALGKDEKGNFPLTSFGNVIPIRGPFGGGVGLRPANALGNSGVLEYSATDPGITAGAFSISWWVRFYDMFRFQNLPSTCGDGAGNYTSARFRRTNGTDFNSNYFFRTNQTQNQAPAYPFIPVSRIWYHMCGVYDNTNIIGYVNGVADAPFPASGARTTASTRGITIGNDALNIGGTTGDSFADFADIAYFTRALSPNEIRMLISPRYKLSNLSAMDLSFYQRSRFILASLPAITTFIKNINGLNYSGIKNINGIIKSAMKNRNGLN